MKLVCPDIKVTAEALELAGGFTQLNDKLGPADPGHTGLLGPVAGIIVTAILLVTPDPSAAVAVTQPVPPEVGVLLAVSSPVDEIVAIFPAKDADQVTAGLVALDGITVACICKVWLGEEVPP
jgi:hypothetical protein